MLLNGSASQVNGGENCARAKRIQTAKDEAKMRAQRASELRLHLDF